MAEYGGYGCIGCTGVPILEKVDSDDEFEFLLFWPPPGRKGLNVPLFEGMSVAIRPSGGVSRSALPSLMDMLQVFR